MKKFIKLIIFSVLIISCKNQLLMKPEKYGFIQIEDSKIYYEVFGQGEPIILIHAGVTDSRMWNYQIG